MRRHACRTQGATRLALGIATASALALASLPASAQEAVAALPQWEGHLVSALSPSAGLLGGVGINVRAGWYARLGLTASAGAVRAGDAWEARQRLDGTARFLFDPFAERARGFYAGAGIGVERRADGSTRGLLLGVVGLEGATRRQVGVRTTVPTLVPSIELTLGGGARLGVVLRGRRRQGR
jgi:hypothetical protein